MAAKKQKTLNDLFEDGLKDIYYAEKRILGALPKMAKATKTEDLAAAFKKHRGETEEQVTRLEKVFELLEQSARGKNAPGSMESSRKARRSWRSLKACRLSTPAFWPVRRPWSIMRSHGTAR